MLGPYRTHLFGPGIWPWAFGFRPLFLFSILFTMYSLERYWQDVQSYMICFNRIAIQVNWINLRVYIDYINYVEQDDNEEPNLTYHAIFRYPSHTDFGAYRFVVSFTRNLVAPGYLWPTSSGYTSHNLSPLNDRTWDSLSPWIRKTSFQFSCVKKSYTRSSFCCIELQTKWSGFRARSDKPLTRQHQRNWNWLESLKSVSSIHELFVGQFVPVQCQSFRAYQISF